MKSCLALLIFDLQWCVELHEVLTKPFANTLSIVALRLQASIGDVFQGWQQIIETSWVNKYGNLSKHLEQSLGALCDCRSVETDKYYKLNADRVSTLALESKYGSKVIEALCNVILKLEPICLITAGKLNTRLKLVHNWYHNLYKHHDIENLSSLRAQYRVVSCLPWHGASSSKAVVLFALWIKSHRLLTVWFLKLVAARTKCSWRKEFCS